MGSWSETCFASNLPIHQGGCRIVAIPVIESRSMSAIRPVRSSYTPVGPPVRGVYDTYGGIDIDEDEKALVEPLRQEILRVLEEVPYKRKDNYRGSLSGIGVEARNEEIHLDETYTERGEEMTRKWVLCGDSSWLRFPVETFPEYPVEQWKYYPVVWCLMLEEVYDYFLQNPIGDALYEQQMRSGISDYFDFLSKTKPPEVREALSEVDILLLKSTLKSEFFSRWAEDFCRVSSFRHLAIDHYHTGVNQKTHDRFYDLVHLMREMYSHRINLSRSTGPQFGAYEKHLEFHRMCCNISEEQMSED